MDPLIELTDAAKARIKTKEAKAAEQYDIVRRACAADFATAYRTWGGFNDLHQDELQNTVDGPGRTLDEAVSLCGEFVFSAHATEYSAVLSIPADLRPVLSNLRESVVKMYGEGARYSIQRLEAAEMEKAEHRHVPIDNRPERREATLGGSSVRNPRRNAEKPLKGAVRRPILPLTVLEAIGEIEERTKRLLQGCRTGISFSEEKATAILRACAVEAFDKKAKHYESTEAAKRLQCLAAELEPTITATLGILGIFDLETEASKRVEQQIRRALKSQLKVLRSNVQSEALRSEQQSVVGTPADAKTTTVAEVPASKTDESEAVPAVVGESLPSKTTVSDSDSGPAPDGESESNSAQNGAPSGKTGGDEEPSGKADSATLDDPAGGRAPESGQPSAARDKSDKNNIDILRGTNGELKRVVTVEVATRFGGVSRRAIEKAVKKGPLEAEGERQNRRISVQSLLKYFPPEDHAN